MLVNKTKQNMPYIKKVLLSITYKVILTKHSLLIIYLNFFRSLVTETWFKHAHQLNLLAYASSRSIHFRKRNEFAFWMILLWSALVLQKLFLLFSCYHTMHFCYLHKRALDWIVQHEVFLCCFWFCFLQIQLNMLFVTALNLKYSLLAPE